MPGFHNRTTTTAYQTIPQLFFWDGDIALAAAHESTKIPVIYRLHRGVLAQHSHYFSGAIGSPVKMFSMTNERCQLDDSDSDAWKTDIIHLAGDPDVLTHLFSAIYYPQHLEFALRKDDPHICLRALSLLTLAREYGMDGIAEAIIDRVREAWPRTLREWDIMESHTSQKHRLFASSGLGLGVCELWDDFLPEPVSTIYFARVANVPDILPAAFYQLSRILRGDDFDENRSEEGVQLNGSKRPSARWSLLADMDLQALSAGKKDMLNFMDDLYCAMLRDAWFCSLGCRRAFINAGPLDSDDILTDLTELCKPDVSPGRMMCSSCRAEVNQKAKSMRASVWEALPIAFKLCDNSP